MMKHRESQLNKELLVEARNFTQQNPLIFGVINLEGTDFHYAGEVFSGKSAKHNGTKHEILTANKTTTHHCII